MEKNSSNNHGREREKGGGDHGLLRSESRPSATTSSDFVLQWGNRKRLRCMKIQVKDRDSAAAVASAAPALRTTVRIDRRVVRSDYNNFKDSAPNQTTTNNNNINAYPNLRQRPSSPSHRILRYSESSIAMKGHSNGVRGRASPEAGGAQDKRGTAHNPTANNGRRSNNDNHAADVGCGASVSSEAAHDSKKGGSSSGSDAIPVVWPPKFVIALTNKEKEEDFMAIKGSKLPQRPKKRAKFIQRNLNLVSPGAWLCDLTLERYEVREKKISKKRPRGLKAMCNMDSDSE